MSDQERTRHLVEGNTAFAVDLYREIRTADGNLFFSPFSISTALAMTFAGARGETAAQMAEVLHFEAPDLHDAFARLNARLTAAEEPGGVRLAVANALWPQAGYAFLEKFIALLREKYASELVALDYQQDPEAARAEINSWVEARTEAKITELIPAGILKTLTRLVLVNAIYFKGSWKSRFEKGLTKDMPFRTGSGEVVRVPTMRQVGEFAYQEFDDVQVLELPYSGCALSMVIVLPKKEDALEELESTLTAATLSRWTKALGKASEVVGIHLPRFHAESACLLTDILQRLGMTDAFDMDLADFSGMDGRKAWLYVSIVLHKAFVDVDEEGSEAAAATAVVMDVRGSSGPRTVFRVDRPFLFLIREMETGSVLFLGRVVDPRPSG